jgi:molybdate transport system ATP-binding protein
MQNQTQARNSAFISANDVTLRIGDRLLFQNTSWELKADQHWAIIGANGSGKSTLADALCRKIPLIQGHIRYFFDGNGDSSRSYLKAGEILKISAEAHKELLRQHAGYHQARWQSFEGQNAPTISELLTGKSIEHHSPYEVTPLKVANELYRKRREEAIDLLGIRHLLSRKIIHVSHGEARKVLIARSLMQAPKLLIFDDPFSGLDNASRELLRKTLEELLAGRRLQIILVTSRGDEILNGITHLLCVDQNRILSQGTKREMLQRRCIQQFFALEKQPRKNVRFQFPVHPHRVERKLETLVEMNQISVRYGELDILQNINWKMKQGEHWALLGHNGAGKTTLLSMILADNPQAYANDIRLFSKKRGSGESIWDIKKHIGWVSPELQIYYHRSISCHQVVCSGFFDSVGLYRTYSPEQSELAKEWLASLKIEFLADRPLNTVSAGEQRVVLLARALVKNPILLVLDEPCQGLDVDHREHILNLLEQLCQQTPMSLIYVTHHFKEMPQTITHVLKLAQGRIQARGSRQEVLGW